MRYEGWPARYPSGSRGPLKGRQPELAPTPIASYTAAPLSPRAQTVQRPAGGAGRAGCPGIVMSLTEDTDSYAKELEVTGGFDIL
jgi:hypothetical protein